MMYTVQSTGQSIVTNTELGRGGEGVVYTIDGQPNTVAKIYHANHRAPEKETKLKSMVLYTPQDNMRVHGHISIAWPQGILLENGNFAGLLMPKIAQSKAFFNLYLPRLRNKHFPGFDFRHLHRAGANVAAAVAKLHHVGHVVGDMNEKNIKVNQQALVTLVDCDSFQVKGPGRVFRCPVGVPDYTPPELQGIRLDSIDRTPEHDRFGLAVIIFKLLMQGFHPFTGKPPQGQLLVSGEKIDISNIRNGYFPFIPSKSGSFTPPPAAPRFRSIHPPLQTLFERAFVAGYKNPALRPSALEWYAALDEAEADLIICPRNSQHYHARHDGNCRWCELEHKQNNASPVPLQKALQPVGAPAVAPPQPAAVTTQAAPGTQVQAVSSSIPFSVHLGFLVTFASLFINSYIPFVGNIVAIMLSHMGLNRITDNPTEYHGEIYADIGVTVSWTAAIYTAYEFVRVYFF